MMLIERKIETREQASDFVLECEARLEDSLDSVANEIVKNKDIKIVTLAGPTCSGKTTAAAKLTGAAEKYGMRARVLSIDDFYKDGKINDVNTNFETADAIDLEYFKICVDGFLGGKTVFLPTYDFKTRKRIALTEYVPDRNDIYIFEGIQAMYPEITAVFSGLGYTSVSIGVLEDVTVGDTFFDKNDIRLARRLLRDYRFRATNVNSTMALWKTVRENEDKNIYPYLDNSEYRINSFLPYEPMYIAKELIPVLSESEVEPEYLRKLTELQSKLERVRCNKIEKDMIPLKSLFREFIG